MMRDLTLRLTNLVQFVVGGQSVMVGPGMEARVTVSESTTA